MFASTYREYPAQHNPTNPILKTFRESGSDVDVWLDAMTELPFDEWRSEDWTNPGHLFHILTVVEDEHIAHAWSVLTLMKNLTSLEV